MLFMSLLSSQITQRFNSVKARLEYTLYLDTVPSTFANPYLFVMNYSWKSKALWQP